MLWEKSRDHLGEHCRVWDCDTNAEWASLGSALSLTDVLNSHAWLVQQKVLFKCELIHKFNFRPNKQQPLRLTEERCHQWRRKQDPPSPQSCKETHSRENPSCLVQMRLEYLAEAIFSGFWSQFSEFLAEPCSSGLLVGHLSPSVALCSQQGFAAGAREPLEAHGICFIPASCATRQLAAGPWGNCVGGKDGQGMAFALRSHTDLATGFIGTFGAIYAGQLFKYGAAGKPSCSHKWGSRWNPRVALQWICVTRPYTQEGTLHPFPPLVQFVNPKSF